MGKSQSAKQSVTDYFMSIYFGLAYKLDSVRRIELNQKEIWSGTAAGDYVRPLVVNQPQVFGGPTSQGGAVGRVFYLPGADDQVLPDELAKRLGYASGAVAPGYRDFSSLYFVGNGPTGGFMWSQNNPAIVQDLWITGTRDPKTVLNQAYASIDNPDFAAQPDTNPAHIIFEVMTDDDWGMGSPITQFEVDSFNAAAATLYSEQFGMSLTWANSTDYEDFNNDILSHINALLYVNPKTGKWKLRLIRDDYDTSTLKVVSPDNATLQGYGRKLWGETTNEVVVTFTDPATEDDATVAMQNLSNAEIQGEIVSTSHNYHGIRHKTLANVVCARDLRSVSAPLASATATVDRTFWDVEPGDCVILEWPEEDVTGGIMRVMDVDYGKPGASQIKLTLLEDIFSLDHAPIFAPVGTGWVDPSSVPEPLAATQVITLPSYFALSTLLQSLPVNLTYPEVLMAVLGYADNSDAVSFTLETLGYDSTGAQTYTQIGSKSVLERVSLAAPLPYSATGEIQKANVLDVGRGPTIGSFVLLGVGNDQDMEFAQVVGSTDTTWVLARGVLDTVPQAWPVGTPCWFVNPGTRIVDETVVRSAGEVVDYKLLTRTSQGVLPVDQAPVIEHTANARPHLPLRPANVAINGVSFGNVSAAGQSTLHVTWATRNRQLEDGQVYRWTDGTIAPEYKQGTVLTAFDAATGAKVFEQPGIWAATAYDLPKAWFDRYASIILEVTSRREDLDSLQGYRALVTGFANNPNAPLPPAAVDTGPPPSPGAAPDPTYWAATGESFAYKDDGVTIAGQVPAVQVSGKRDRPDAADLVVRYTRDGSKDTIYLGERALDDYPVVVASTAVAPQTRYLVEIAYQSADNILSNWTSLGEVLTGDVISQAVGDLTAQDIKDKLQHYDDLTQDIETRLSTVDQVVAAAQSDADDALKSAEDALTKIDTLTTGITDQVNKSITELLGDLGFATDLDVQTLAEANIRRSLESDAFKRYTDALTRVDGITVKSLAQATQTVTNDLVDTMNVIVVRNGPASSSLVRYDKVKTGVNPDGTPYTLADSLIQVNSAIGQNASTAATLYETKTDASTSYSTINTTLTSTFQNYDAGIKQTYITKADSQQALSGVSTQLTSQIGTVSSNLSVNYLTKADTNSAISAINTSLGSQIQGVSSNLSQNYYTSAQTNQAISSLNTSLTTQIGNLSSNVSQNYVTYTTLNSTTASLTTSLKSYADSTASGQINQNNSAYVNANFTTQATTNNLIASARYDLGARIDSTNSNISQNYVTNVSQSNALSSLSTSLLSQSAANAGQQINNNNSAYVSANYTTFTQQNSAFASYDNTIKSYIAGGVGAQVNQNIQTVANIGGMLSGTYSLTVGAGGALAGMRIYASGGVGYTDIGVIALDADYLQIGKGPDRQNAFLYDTNAHTLYLGNIVARNGNIQDLSVTTLKVADGAITTTVSTAGDYGGGLQANGGGNTTICSASLNCSGKRVLITGFVVFKHIGGPSPIDGSVVVTRDGGAISPNAFQFLQSGFRSGIPFAYMDQPPAGSHTYGVVNSIGGGVNVNVWGFSMTVTDLMK